MIRNVVRAAKQFGYSRLIRHADRLDSKDGTETYLVKAFDKGDETIILQSKLSALKFGAGIFNVNLYEPNVIRPLESDATAGPHPENTCFLKLHPSRHARSFWFNVPGGVIWRCFRFIGDAASHRVMRAPDVAEQAFLILNRFHEKQCSLPASFQHIFRSDPTECPQHYNALLDAISKNPEGRVEKCPGDIKNAIMANKQRIPIFSRHGEMGNASNLVKSFVASETILPALHSSLSFCAVNLDSVAPGLSHYGPLGENIVAAESINHTAKDERTKQSFTNLSLDTLIKSLGAILTRNEHVHLVLRGRHLAHSLGVQFLTDYILGDIKFPSDFPGHNLVRSREMFRLSSRLEECKNIMLQEEREIELV
jgi:hypothetical protein